MVLYERKISNNIDFSLVAVQRLIDILMNKSPKSLPKSKWQFIHALHCFYFSFNKANNKLMKE